MLERRQGDRFSRCLHRRIKTRTFTSTAPLPGTMARSRSIDVSQVMAVLFTPVTLHGAPHTEALFSSTVGANPVPQITALSPPPAPISEGAIPSIFGRMYNGIFPRVPLLPTTCTYELYVPAARFGTVQLNDILIHDVATQLSSEPILRMLLEHVASRAAASTVIRSPARTELGTSVCSCSPGYMSMKQVELCVHDPLIPRTRTTAMRNSSVGQDDYRS